MKYKKNGNEHYAITNHTESRLMVYETSVYSRGPFRPLDRFLFYYYYILQSIIFMRHIYDELSVIFREINASEEFLPVGVIFVGRPESNSRTQFRPGPVLVRILYVLYMERIFHKP